MKSDAEEYRISYEQVIELSLSTDGVHAVVAVKHLTEEVGFDVNQQALIGTAVSELATNALRYAGSGTVTARIIETEKARGVEVVVSDKGPGIPNIEKAMTERYTTGDSLGLGLTSVKRLMDDMEIDTASERGTRILIRKWNAGKSRILREDA